MTFELPDGSCAFVDTVTFSGAGLAIGVAFDCAEDSEDAGAEAESDVSGLVGVEPVEESPAFGLGLNTGLAFCPGVPVPDGGAIPDFGELLGVCFGPDKAPVYEACTPWVAAEFAKSGSALVEIDLGPLVGSGFANADLGIGVGDGLLIGREVDILAIG